MAWAYSYPQKSGKSNHWGCRLKHSNQTVRNRRYKGK